VGRAISVDERTARDAREWAMVIVEELAALVGRLAETPTPAGPTPRELGTADAFTPLTTLSDSLRPTDHGTSHDPSA
jgi:hypothetical protein